MALSLRDRRSVALIEHEVERRSAIVDLGLVDLFGVHRPDQIGAREHEPAVSVCSYEPALEVIEGKVAGLAVAFDRAPDRGHVDLLTEPPLGADARDRLADSLQEVLYRWLRGPRSRRRDSRRLTGGRHGRWAPGSLQIGRRRA